MKRKNWFARVLDTIVDALLFVVLLEWLDD